MRISTLLALILVGCGSGGGGNPDTSVLKDMAMGGGGDMALVSACGHPGDQPVNSLGVGKFCMTIADCQTDPNAKTNICSALGNSGGPDDTYFCTIYPCHPDGGVMECGDNATCECGSGGGMSGCACTPNKCLGTPDMK